MKLTKIDQADFAIYLKYKKKNPLKPSTVTKYIGILNVCLPFWKTHDYSEENLLILFEEERKRDIENVTLKNYKKLYTHVDNYLIKRGILVTPVSFDVGIGIVEEKDFCVLSPAEIDKLTHCFLPNRNNELYNTVYMAFSEVGCRPSALLPVTWDKFNYSNKTLDIYNPKNNLWSTKVISTQLAHAIQALPRLNARIFPIAAPTLNEDIKLRAKAVGIIKAEPITLKTFRKSVGTQSVEDDIHWNDIMDRLDHTDPKSLRSYIKKSKKNQQRFLQKSSITKNRLTKQDKYMHYLAKYRELKDEMMGSGMTADEIHQILGESPVLNG